MESEIKKKLSGAQNRKRHVAKEAENKKQTGALNRFVKIFKSADVDCNQLVKSEITVNEPCISSSLMGSTVPTIEQDVLSKEKLEENLIVVDNEINTVPVNLEDPGKWGTVDEKIRVALIELGPFHTKNIIYPRDTHGRKFGNTYYNRKMENGELVTRTWLIYSESLNSVFCFCCKLFAHAESSSLVQGYNDWRNLSTTLHRHETSLTRMKNYLKWKELDRNLKNKITIDCQTQSVYDMEKKHLTSVLERLIEIVKFLGGQNLAFRGSSSKLYEKNNGNFFKYIELFAKFDPVMEHHVERALQPNNRVHYLSKDSQNEILEILSSAIRNSILSSIQKSKYYSIILDCTPDASKTEQLTIIIRFVSNDNGIVKIRENFLGFVDISDSTGHGLCATMQDQLEKWNIPIENMRGQGYNNAANMKGKRSGLQNLLLNKNPRAFYVPCAAHTLNLIINDAAKENVDTISFFTIVQGIYNFFSASTKRWTILLKFVKNLTLKQPSDRGGEVKLMQFALYVIS